MSTLSCAAQAGEGRSDGIMRVISIISLFYDLFATTYCLWYVQQAFSEPSLEATYWALLLGISCAFSCGCGFARSYVQFKKDWIDTKEEANG
jgi:hypothetical protein